MWDIKVTPEQIGYAKKMVARYNFGNRGYGDGNAREQFVGVLGQTVLADILGQERPTGQDGFDQGVDFVINGLKVDIKTMSRTVPVKPHYVHNFIGYQKTYSVDYYIFASFNTVTNVLSLCGCISKEGFFAKAAFYEKGEKRFRDDGTFFINKAPLYEISQSDLTEFDNKEELLKDIR